MTTDAHGRGNDRPESFTDGDVRAPDHAERARTLLAGQRTGVLSTLALEPAGYPYGSFVTFAFAGKCPVFLISRIAEHTRNLVADGRASLLVHESGSPDPLANARLTLVGRCEKRARPANGERAAFLAAHPQASYYADFTDFDFWALEVASIRYIGGYGRMSWVDPDAFARATPDPLADSAAGMITHMNQDHRDALVLYARAFTRAQGVQSVVMTAIDRYGFELTITTEHGVGPARIAFDAPLTEARQARQTLIALTASAQQRLA